MDPGKGEPTRDFFVCLFVILYIIAGHTQPVVLLLRSWGVCFTYGTWFGLEAFACMGHVYKDE